MPKPIRMLEHMGLQLLLSRKAWKGKLDFQNGGLGCCWNPLYVCLVPAISPGVGCNAILLKFGVSHVFSSPGADLALLRSWTSLGCGAVIRESFLIFESILTVELSFLPSKLCKLLPALLFQNSQSLIEFLVTGRCELVFENCFVPNENILGQEGKGVYTLVRHTRTQSTSLRCAIDVFLLNSMPV